MNGRKSPEARAYEITAGFFSALGKGERDPLELARETKAQFDQLKKETGFDPRVSYRKSLVGPEQWLARLK